MRTPILEGNALGTPPVKFQDVEHLILWRKRWPSGHLNAFNYLMELHQVSSFAKCRCLVVTLTKWAKKWFRGLPLGFIESWKQLVTSFLQNFQANRRFSMPLNYLSNIRQERAKTLKSYLEKFNREWGKVVNAPRESIWTLLMVRVNLQTEFWRELQVEDNMSFPRFYKMAKKHQRVKNSLAAIKYGDVGGSINALARDINEGKERKKRYAVTFSYISKCTSLQVIK